MSSAVEQFRASDKILTASNVVSLLRVLLVIPTAIFLHNKEHTLTALTMIIAYATDLLDGYIARKTNTVSEWGKVIDPLADKLFVGIVILLMVLYDYIPWWFAATVLFRDCIIFIGGIFLQRRLAVVLPSNWAGKVAVFTISLSLFLAVLGVSHEVLVLSWGISLTIAVVSLIIYIKRAVTLLRS